MGAGLLDSEWGAAVLVRSRLPPIPLPQIAETPQLLSPPGSRRLRLYYITIRRNTYLWCGCSMFTSALVDFSRCLGTA